MALTLRELARVTTQHCIAHPGDLDLPVVLSGDSEGNSARTLESVDFFGWYQPIEELPAMGDILADDDADPATDQRVVTLWPTV